MMYGNICNYKLNIERVINLHNLYCKLTSLEAPKFIHVYLGRLKNTMNYIQHITVIILLNTITHEQNHILDVASIKLSLERKYNYNLNVLMRLKHPLLRHAWCDAASYGSTCSMHNIQVRIRFVNTFVAIMVDITVYALE